MRPLSNLFSPIKIGALELKNRIVMSPMGNDLGNPDGTVSQRAIDYFEARARGGAGLIVLGSSSVDSISPYKHPRALWDDRFIPGFRELTDAYLEFESKQQRIESALVQAEFRLAQDPRDRENMLAAEGFLAEADKLLEELGETDRTPEVEEKRNTLQQRHREALTEELNGLLQKLDETCRGRGSASQNRTATLANQLLDDQTCNGRLAYPAFTRNRDCV